MPHKAITYAFAKEYFKKHQCVLLESEFVNSKTYMKYICSCGNKSKIIWNSFQQGRRCKKCGRERANRKTSLDFNFVEKYFRKHKCKLLEKSYKNSATPMRYVCSCGRESKIAWSSFQHGSRCKVCGIKKNMEALRLYHEDGPDYDHYAPKLFADEVRRNPDNNKCIQARCKQCGKWMTPGRGQIKTRIRASMSAGGHEANFYCNDKCKNSCILYRFKPGKSVDPRSDQHIIKTEQQEARGCQTNHLKQIQCDNTGGQSFCEKCGDFIDVELHHTLELKKHGKKAINSASHMLLCAGCHTKLHAAC